MAEIGRRTGPLDISGLSGSQAAFFLAELFTRSGRCLLVVAPDEAAAGNMVSDLEFFLPSGNDQSPVVSFPAYHILPYSGIAFNSQTIATRISALYRLLNNAAPLVLVTTPKAACARLMAASALCDSTLGLFPGKALSRDGFAQSLVEGGFVAASVVEEPGEFGVRGGIVDLFSPGHEYPLRVEFFGDEIDSIRLFSPADQRTVKRLDEAVVLPASEAVVRFDSLAEVAHRFRARALEQGLAVTKVREIVQAVKEEGRLGGMDSFLPLVYGRTDSLVDYLPGGCIPVIVEPGRVAAQAASHKRNLLDHLQTMEAKERLFLPAEKTLDDWDRVLESLSCLNPLFLRELAVSSGQGQPQTLEAGCCFSVKDNSALSAGIAAGRDPDRLLEPLVQWIETHRAEGRVVAAACANRTRAERLRHLLLPYGLSLKEKWQPSDPGRKPGLYLAQGRLSAGFVWESEGLAIFTDDEVFGPSRRHPKTPPARPRTDLLDLTGLKQGDFVVHLEHGVACFEGLAKMEVNGVAGDFLVLAFQDRDRLYVPVDRTHQVQKYRGVSEAAPSLDRLGGKRWETVKNRARKTAQKIAADLVELYARRKVEPGFAFSPADDYFAQFEAGFEFEETPDQARAILEVIADMEADTPMDRLVCGDVGYGKTEVALRASFKAVADGKQVALLAPTTILAEQHFKTFSQRLAAYPISVAGLNRFRSPVEQKKLTEELAAGKVDIIVGTHRLLQKDVKFRDLGLIIIDEEQRFGVSHKEKLKKLRASVDALALTATPIPRTLHMTLSGIRDISVINTPPEQRRPITTYIIPFDNTVLAQAIKQEKERGGQVFFVHNRVQTIWNMANLVKKLAPDARIGVAHGQLAEKDLEKVMAEFVAKKIDVLVCTAIVESGLDIATANTIIINRADMFGLAQMYQLRGRVGRSDTQAYAYLIIPDESVLTRDAQRRLKVLMEHSDLGSGFQIAMSDLQIRGGGSILGAAQSGHIAAVGYELYLSLVEEAVRAIKGEPDTRPLEPEINVDFDAYLPSGYIPDMDQRLVSYRRLSRVADTPELSAFQKELADRYGELPKTALRLLYKVMLKLLARKAGIRRLDLAGTVLRLSPSPEHQCRPEGAAALVAKNRQTMRLFPDGELKVNLEETAIEARVLAAKNILKELASHVSL
jgi:transcription-repair coupling factor (superfamily II helicase)